MSANQAGCHSAFSERLLREAAEISGQRDKWPGKRRHARVVAGIPLDMEVMGKVHCVQCFNASLGGLVVLCRRSVPPKAFEDGVRVRYSGDGDDAWVPVRVQHVTQTVSGFKVGMAYKS